MDLIEQFLAYTDNGNSPEAFRLWSAISLVAGTLERRVWVKTGRGLAFPNQYILLMAAPGIGKQVIDLVKDLWRDTQRLGKPALHVAPDNVTKASLLDALADAEETFMPPAGGPVTYSALQIAAEEFGVLLPQYDTTFMVTLNKIHNNPRDYTETRRTSVVKNLSIKFPLLNMLGGYQPALMGTTFPEEAWSSGFARRLIMIYAGKAPRLDLFFEPEGQEDLRKAMLVRLGRLAQTYGHMTWEAAAADYIADWDMHEESRTAPTHSKLQYYATDKNRTYLLLKLAVVSAAAGERMVIALSDVKRALAWLLSAEAEMPQVFRAMVGKSDTAVLEELWSFCWQEHGRNRAKGGVGDELLFKFLSQRVPTEKIVKLLEVAERSNLLQLVAGSNPKRYLPRPKPEHGME